MSLIRVWGSIPNMASGLEPAELEYMFTICEGIMNGKDVYPGLDV